MEKEVDAKFNLSLSQVSGNVIRVTPNPTKGNVYVSGTDNGVFILTNAIGQIATKVTIEQNNGQVDLSAFPKGIYTYSIVTYEGFIRGKIILQ